MSCEHQNLSIMGLNIVDIKTFISTIFLIQLISPDSFVKFKNSYDDYIPYLFYCYLELGIQYSCFQCFSPSFCCLGPGVVRPSSIILVSLFLNFSTTSGNSLLKS